MKGIEQNRWRDTCYIESFRLGKVIAIEVRARRGRGSGQARGARTGQIVDGENDGEEQLSHRSRCRRGRTRQGRGSCRARRARAGEIVDG